MEPRINFYTYPVPFCLIQNFLTPEEKSNVHEELKKVEPRLMDPKFTGAARDDHGNIRVKRKGLFLQEYYSDLSESQIGTYMNRIVEPGFVNTLAQNHWIYNYLSSLACDSVLVSYYKEGDEYLPHRDSCTMTAIYYTWTNEFRGGELKIHNVTVPIEDNCLIVFPSCVEHSVSKIEGAGRWAISSFMNTKCKIGKLDGTNISVFKNFLSPEDFTQMSNILKNSRNWHFGQSSNNDGKNPFWMLNLSNDPFFTDYLFNKIPNGPWKLQRVYANGQAYGQNGEFHQDSNMPNDWTFLLYTNPIAPEQIGIWGGETQFLISDKNCIIEKPDTNKAVLFKSDIEHRGMGPSRHVNGIRVTVAWKLSRV